MSRFSFLPISRLGAFLAIACWGAHAAGQVSPDKPGAEAPSGAKPEEGKPEDAKPAEDAKPGEEAKPGDEAKPKKKKKRIETTPIVDAEPPLESMPAKRDVPDYDGRGEDPSTAGDTLLWIPRVLLSPLYLVADFLVRRPLGAVITAVEHDKIAQRAIYFFTFGGKKTMGWVPTFFYDFNLLPSVGIYYWWDDVGVKKNHLRFHIGTWGPEWINTTLSDRYDLGEHSTIALRATFSRRRDLLFYGLGPDSRNDLKSRYEAITFDAGPVYDLEVARGVHFSSAAGVRTSSFGEGTCCNTPTLHARVRAGQLAAPPRLEDGYTLIYQRVEAAFDTREGRRPASQSGVRLVVNGQPAFDMTRSSGGASWVSYGATAGGFWDVTGTYRVLSASVSTLFTDPIHGGAGGIPFTELTTLGGFGLMRGFLPGRLVDRSAAVATLGYQWPVWAFLDGTLQASVGNVFGAGLRGFDAGKLRLSTGLGLRTNSSPDHQFEVLAGFGTDTFDAGAGITSFRLALGATRGF